MSPDHKEILDIAARTPEGLYGIGGYDLYIDKDHDGSIRVTALTTAGSNYLIYFNGEASIYQGHLSWWPAKNKSADAIACIIYLLRKLDKRRSFKPLLQRLREWWRNR